MSESPKSAPPPGGLTLRFPLVVSLCLIAGVSLKVLSPELHAAICGPLPVAASF